MSGRAALTERPITLQMQNKPFLWLLEARETYKYRLKPPCTGSFMSISDMPENGTSISLAHSRVSSGYCGQTVYFWMPSSFIS